MFRRKIYIIPITVRYYADTRGGVTIEICIHNYMDILNYAYFTNRNSAQLRRVGEAQQYNSDPTSDTVRENH